MNDRASLLRAIDEMLERLSRPLSSDERANGWSEEKRVRWHRWFQEHRAQIPENPKLSGMARAMDFDGIEGGELLELAGEHGTATLHPRRACG